jgi:adenylate kinase family enzyme
VYINIRDNSDIHLSGLRAVSRIAIIGNAGGGKSTLARVLSRQRGLRHVEIDQLLWQEGWKLSPADVYARQHADLIAGESWIIDGLGQFASIPDRLSRATEIILIDMPLWVHFWLAAERQLAWTGGKLEHPPGGISTIPPMQAIFRTMWDVEQTWMPEVRALCASAEANGTAVTRITSLEELQAITLSDQKRVPTVTERGAP